MFKTLELTNDKLKFIDQTKLPLVEEYIDTDNYERIAQAIERLEIRGAPAIGVAAAYGLALSLKFNSSKENFILVYNRLVNTRPTAVNLFWALNEIKRTFEKEMNSNSLFKKVLSKAIEIHNDDIHKCDKIGKNSLKIFKKRSNILTHCNAGALATAGEGTAINVIKEAYKNDLIEFVYVDETRPLFQGSRLTAFELHKAGIPFKIITDSTAAFVMQQYKIDLVVTGADRIAVNGDSANKIGTYSLAVSCKHHNIPFYIAAPTSTIDKECKTGNNINIEERSKDEVIQYKNESITNPEYEVYSPAFDVTPSNLITGIITEERLYQYPYKF